MPASTISSNTIGTVIGSLTSGLLAYSLTRLYTLSTALNNSSTMIGHYADETTHSNSLFIVSVRTTLLGVGLIHSRTIWFKLSSGHEVILFLKENGYVYLKDAPKFSQSFLTDPSSVKWKGFKARPLKELQKLLSEMNSQKSLCCYDFSVRNCAIFVSEIYDRFYITGK